MLQNIPSSTRCFIDASIFIYHFVLAEPPRQTVIEMALES